MARRFPQLCVYILLLSTLLQTRQIRCLRRLTRRKLSIETDDIHSILSSTLDSNPSQIILSNNNKRDASNEALASVDSLAEDNVASESKDASFYEDEAEEDDTREQDLEDSEYKRSVESDPSADSPAEKSADQADPNAYDDFDLREVKDVAKREAKNEDDYDEDLNADALVSSDDKVAEVEASSTNAKSTENLEKIDNRREANAEEMSSDSNLEKQIEDQIQRRINSIKEDIKREIERKQQVREIEANNAKYDELEFNREDNEVADDETSDSSKRSISRDREATNEVGKSDESARTKRSDLELESDEVADDEASDSSKKRSISRDAGASNEVEKSGRGSALRSKRSDLKEVVKNEENKESALILPVKKRSLERRVTLVEKRDPRSGKRKDRSSILIPERGHAEVKDELPGDLTLDSNLRLARSDRDDAVASGGLRSARSVVNREEQATRYRRDMADEAESEERAVREGNFLFVSREKPDCGMRRRRSRGREKARKRPRNPRRHRTIRESSMNDEELEDERDKRAMSLDEDAALEYKESFGGFQSDSNGALGRFKRIRRSSKIS